MFQHEHALVTLDDECRVVMWDQYGDTFEQQVVDQKIGELMTENATSL